MKKTISSYEVSLKISRKESKSKIITIPFHTIQLRNNLVQVKGLLQEKKRNAAVEVLILLCKVKIPQGLRPRFLADELSASLAVPVLAPGASRANLRFEFHRMVVFLADAADDSPVPPVPVPSLRADVCTSLELHVFRSTDGSAAQV